MSKAGGAVPELNRSSSDTIQSRAGSSQPEDYAIRRTVSNAAYWNDIEIVQSRQENGGKREARPGLRLSQSNSSMNGASSADPSQPNTPINYDSSSPGSEQNLAPRPGKIRKRVSALSIRTDDGDTRQISPRLRRSYPIDASVSPLPSPLPQLDDETKYSPSSRLYLSPRLPTSSPTHGRGISGSYFPPAMSPRIATFVDPLKQLASGLSQRVVSASSPSTSDFNELPTARIETSRRVSSPSVMLSEVAGVLSRKSSFLSGKRSAEVEKAEELEARTEKDHKRQYSWSRNYGKKISWRKKAALFGMIVLTTWIMYRRGAVSSGATVEIEEPVNKLHQEMAAGRMRRNSRRGLRRKTTGFDFIHPDVLNPRYSPGSSPTVISSNIVFSSYQRLTQSIISAYRRLRSKKAHHHRRLNPDQVAPVEFHSHEALPPSPDHHDDPHRDTIVLYRILGNDLPPRHSHGQTLRNLRFLLQHESDFSSLPHAGPHPEHHSKSYGSGSGSRLRHVDDAQGGLRVDKYFVLNRIIDAQVLESILGLLRLYSVPESRILMIPFEMEQYERRAFRWDAGIDAFEGWGIGGGVHSTPLAHDTDPGAGWDTRKTSAGDRHTLSRLRALDFMYHEKNLYVMNNNGGRNYALDHGRTLKNARWILPLDGASFLTPAAMNAIVSTLSIKGEGATASRYVVMPMERLLTNEDVMLNNSITLVPQHHHDHDPSTADAELAETVKGAPPSLEEPQIGFRYDATESYEPSMRYGRRSKLELLWRLGAIPYSEGLDKRKHPWESRSHISVTTWGSIPGVAHLSQVVIPTVRSMRESSPIRGPLAFSKAGWIYRLFSGDRTQEEFTPEAKALRHINRIKGIIGLLEKLDAEVSRGLPGCAGATCGFNSHDGRLWSYSIEALEALRQEYEWNPLHVDSRVKDFIEDNKDVARIVEELLIMDTAELTFYSPEWSAAHALELALAGHLTANQSLSTLAAKLIERRFLSVPMDPEQREQLMSYHDLRYDQSQQLIVEEGEVTGYAFPFANDALYSIENAHWAIELEVFAFDPLTFNPTQLIDAVRILALSPATALSPDSIIAMNSLAVSHLSYLLFSTQALDLSAKPETTEDGVDYDLRVCVLASFLNDARLMGRVVNRARLRTTRKAQEDDDEGILLDVFKPIIKGLKNLRFRPFDVIELEEYGDDYIESGKTPLEKLRI